MLDADFDKWPGQHVPAAQENPGRGGSHVFGDLRALTALTARGDGGRPLTVWFSAHTG